MTDRDRLIELIKKAEKEFSLSNRPVLDIEEYVTDYLLANGAIVPLCKVHDIVYYLNTTYHMALKKNAIYKAKVIRIETTYLGTCLVIHIRGDEGSCCEIVSIKEWGKTVFLTKEEAEKKLKEYKDISERNYS